MQNEKSLPYCQAIAILSHINPVHTASSYLFQISFNIILQFSHNFPALMYQITCFNYQNIIHIRLQVELVVV
jgi:hypothetical protein